MEQAPQRQYQVPLTLPVRPRHATRRHYNVSKEFEVFEELHMTKKVEKQFLRDLVKDTYKNFLEAEPMWKTECIFFQRSLHGEILRHLRALVEERGLPACIFENGVEDDTISINLWRALFMHAKILHEEFTGHPYPGPLDDTLEDMKRKLVELEDNVERNEDKGKGPRYLTIPRGKRYREVEHMQSFGFSALTLESTPRKPTTWNFIRDQAINEEGEACNPYEIPTKRRKVDNQPEEAGGMGRLLQRVRKSTHSAGREKRARVPVGVYGGVPRYLPEDQNKPEETRTEEAGPAEDDPDSDVSMLDADLDEVSE
ncbi:hypothetical protein N7488_005308 [Penicillium malachiteum]|nr:hypothetical protein N7488_005308 [Penicillium malachiteum]